MTATRAVWLLVATGVGLSLLALTLVFTCAAATSIHTVMAAISRSRHRPAALGDLAGTFPMDTLVELDERLERCLLDVETSSSP